MVESLPEQQQQPIESGKIYSVSNSRRVLTQVKKLTDNLFLGADSMYGGNTMDGRFKLFTVEDLVAASQGGAKLNERFFVEVPYGVTALEHFTINQQELIVAGLDDGTL